MDPHLDLKIALFFLAAVLGVGGMLFGRPMMIYAAMVAIGVGLLLRFFGRGGARHAGPNADSEDAAG